MSDEEKPLDLRDKIALEILNGMLGNSALTTWSTVFGDGFINERETMTLIRVSYKMADMVRKVRIAAFE